MMRKLGFEEAWISKIMTCVTTVSYAVLVDDQPSQVITPTRGLRQGDLISPYLHFICAGGLNSLFLTMQKFVQG